MYREIISLIGFLIPKFARARFFILDSLGVATLAIVGAHAAMNAMIVKNEWNKDIFHMTGCAPQMRFSAWRMCVGSAFSEITQSKRNCLNILGSACSQCYICKFSDSKETLYMSSLVSALDTYVFSLFVVYFTRRFCNGFLSPIVVILLFFVAAGLKWLSIFHNFQLLGGGIPIHLQLKVVEVASLEFVNVFSTLTREVKLVSEESVITSIEDSIDALEESESARVRTARSIRIPN